MNASFQPGSPSASSSPATVISDKTLVRGTLSGEGSVHLRGRVEGVVNLSETLHVEERGVAKADIQVKNIVIAGIVVGNILATESVHVLATGRVVGDIQTPRFIVMAGGACRGRVDMGVAAGIQNQLVTATQVSHSQKTSMNVPSLSSIASSPVSAPPRVESMASFRSQPAASPSSWGGVVETTVNPLRTDMQSANMMSEGAVSANSSDSEGASALEIAEETVAQDNDVDTASAGKKKFAMHPHQKRK